MFVDDYTGERTIVAIVGSAILLERALGRIAQVFDRQTYLN